MLLVLSKVLAIPMYPVGLAIVLSLAAAGALWRAKRNAALVLAMLAAGLLWFFSLAPVSHWLLRGLESRYQPLLENPGASAIVSLGGYARPPLPPRQYVETGDGGDRLMLTAKLFQDKRAPYLIVTGGRIGWMSHLPGTEAENIALSLEIFFGIAGDNVILEKQSKTTHDHPRYVGEILSRLGLKKDIILVTSASHMYRSVKLFEKQGFTVHPAPTDYMTEKDLNFTLFQVLPEVGCLEASTKALHEYYGLAAYKILGWI